MKSTLLVPGRVSHEQSLWQHISVAILSTCPLLKAGTLGREKSWSWMGECSAVTERTAKSAQRGDAPGTNI